MLRFTALVTLVLMLAGCTSAPDPVPQAPLSARVEPNDYKVKFVVEGYAGGKPATITIRSITGAVFADHAAATPEGEYILDTIDRQAAVVDQLTYTWNTPDGRSLTGEFLYANPHNTQKWQIDQTEHLVLYHVNPLEPGEAAALERAALDSSDLVGVPLPNPHIALYLFPDHDSLKRLYGEMGYPPPVSGFTYPGYTCVRGGIPIADKMRIVAHETVHQLGSMGGLLALAEGFPEYAAQVEMARIAHETGSNFDRQQWLIDNLTKLTEQVKLGGYSKINLEAVPLMEPEHRNAYLVGTALILYVRSEYGEDGIRKLFTLYRNDSSNTLVMKGLFDASFASIQNQFNWYLSRGKALEDARTVFDIND